MKKSKFKRVTALASCSLLLAASTVGAVAALPGFAASYNNEYSVDVAKAFQEFDGWGLSLSWWATEIGDWTRIGSSGKEKREEIMEAIYGESGLNLNIARYNVGGGDDPSHTHMTDDRNTPGWRTATKQTFTDASGEYETYVLDDYLFVGDDGNDIPWQELAEANPDARTDYRQLWVLDWIQNVRGGDDLITEYYSNSPPYWMTIAECSSGGAGGWDNLDPSNNEDFVTYFLDVYEYLVRQGFEFQNLQPFNESGSNYWGTNGDQEGAYFSPSQKVEILQLLREQMEERGIDAKYNWGDETNTTVSREQYEAALKYSSATANGAEVYDGADRYTYHIYWYDVEGLQRLYRNVKPTGKELYMSEITWSDGDKYDSDDMTTGFHYTSSIIDTIKHGGVDAFVFWQGMEDMVGQIKGNTNYGLIQGVYSTQEEAEAQGTDLAAMGLSYQDFVLAKAYYMSGQFTKYIKAGYTIVDITDDGSLAAISPDGQTLVVVKQNNSANADSFKLDLKGFKASSVEKIYTDQTHNWKKSYVSTNGSSVVDTVGGRSVTTYVITGERTGSAGHFLDDSVADFSYSTISAIEAAIAEKGDVEQFYGTYSVSDRDCSTDTYFGCSYTNQQKYMVFHFKGTGIGLTFPQKSDAGTISVQIDGGAEQSVNLKSNNKITKGIVYENKDLEDGWHTVIVKSVSGWVNFDGAFLYTARDRAESGQTLAVTDAIRLGKSVSLTYEAVGYEGYEIYAEYNYGGAWKRVENALSDGRATFEIAAVADEVLLRLVAVKDGEEVYSALQVVTAIETKEGVLYFVDAGTSTPNTPSQGALLGQLQSVSDQAYGSDPISGLKWGYTNTVRTAYYEDDEAMASSMSTDNTAEGVLEYKFTIPKAGTYNVALGFCGLNWGSRNETLTVAGQTKDTTLNNLYSAEYFTVTTSAENEEISIKVAKAAGESQGAMVSVIVITQEDVSVPLYADGYSNYSTWSSRKLVNVEIGSDLYAEIEKESFTVYLSDGTTKTLSTAEEGVSVDVKMGLLVAGGEVNVTFAYNGLEIEVVYAWQQPRAQQLYYNIDIGYIDEAGTPPGDAAELGSKQSTTRDRQYGPDEKKGTSWGYVGDGWGSDGSNGVNWKNDSSAGWSIREEKVAANGTLTYKMTGFAPNEKLRIMTGGHCEKWSGRSYNVNVNGTKVGTITLKQGNDSQTAFLIYEEFVGDNVKADANGELTITYTKVSGDNPQVGYIKVWSLGEDLETEAAITADKTTVSRDGNVNLRNLNTEGTVYVLDENKTILGNFKPTGATQEVKVADYLPATSYELHFTQVSVDTLASAELVVDVPGVDVVQETEFVKDGDATVILFKPHAVHGVTALTLTTPDGVKVNVAEGFYYRAKANGTYTITILSNGVSYSEEFEVDNIDTVDFDIEYSTTDWTKDAVTVTLNPTAASGIASVEIDGVVTDDYVITATENGEHTVKVVTNAGFPYEKTVVIDNIDKAAPQLELAFDFSVSAGLSLGYTATSASGGKLLVSHNGGDYEEVTELSAISLDEAGKYELYFVSGSGLETQKATYYVTYGAGEAQLATVTLGEDGTVSLADKAKAALSAKLYRAGEPSAIENMKAAKAGKYYLEIEKDGEKEVVIFNVTSASVAGEGGGLTEAEDNRNAMIVGIVFGAVALVAAAIVCPVLMKGRKKS